MHNPEICDLIKIPFINKNVYLRGLEMHVQWKIFYQSIDLVPKFSSKKDSDKKYLLTFWIQNVKFVTSFGSVPILNEQFNKKKVGV